MKIRVPNGRETPQYSNLSIIDSKFEEIILNLAYIEGDEIAPIAALVAKIALHPRNAKRLCRALDDALSAYEKKYGQIEDKPIH